MISGHLIGGLGNQMFIIAAVEALAKRQTHHVDVKFFAQDYWNADTLHDHERWGSRNLYEYVDTIYDKINIEIDDSLPPTQEYQEPHFDYRELPFIDDVTYSGYFQSEKYFLDCSDYIREIFSPSSEISSYLNEEYLHIDFSSATSLHVRRGDYVLPRISPYHPLCSLDYYKAALDSIGKINQVLVFTPHTDTEWCKNNIIGLSNTETVVIETEKEWIGDAPCPPEVRDLYMMSLCKNHILSNSSFGWWGAWLADSKNVTAPRKWFNHMAASDIYCNGWKIL